MRTLRSRMIVIILGVITLCWLALIPLTQSKTREQINALMDQRAESMADALLVILEGEVKEPEAIQIRGPVHHYESEPPFPFQLWVEDELRARTVSTPDFAQPYPDTPAWREVNLDGEGWRVLTRQKAIFSSQKGGLVNAWAVVGIRLNDLNALADSLVWRSSWPLFVSLPLLAITVFFGIGIGLRPLRELAEQVSQRSPRQLKHVVAEQVPGEVRPLVKSLNHLFGEVQRAFANEKRFTADAAHELRTPLSALSAQAQVALRSNDELSKQKALRQIVHGVDRLTHLVSQLLTLARLDPQSAVEDKSVDLVAITREVMAELGASAVDKKLDFSLISEETAMAHGDPGLISILIRNLVDNAIKYSPAQGSVRVSIAKRDGRAEVEVIDTGPGIPSEYRDQVFRRFFRLADTEGFGTGLGLSIADQIASLHNAKLFFRDQESQGLVVVVSFPVETDTNSSAAVE